MVQRAKNLILQLKMSSRKFAPANWFKKTAPIYVNNSQIVSRECEPVETSDKFKIVIVLDESGSMQDVKQDMIKAINSLITEQQQVKERPALFTLVKFNNQVTRVIKNLDLREVSLLTDNDYVPSATTALYDALGDTINWFRYEKDVLMVVVTDGMENASRTYTHDQVKIMLDEKKEHRNWSYVYLSNDLSTARQADSLGMSKSRFATNRVLRKGGHGRYISKNINEAISNYRKEGLSVQAQLNSEY